ncbi:hypothetical protein CCMSSC00406_0007495 [Pleurotus cornucopiae]|uniref:Uncharacterized protein n=1 Tax=Pleurotus cornucopiae TaxID=5321 RepID=A0ACB7J4Y6_PLECO|nr:hypothetical protein CCMSSC00406_0007495 [Pleurotus cornucopiae]
MAGKTHVFIVGATGYTGGAIAKALLEAGTFRLSILIGESSINKPVNKELTEAGAEVVRGDISESPEKLESYLKGVDVLISTVPVMVDQKPLILAAKQAGVGRVVPSDFGPIAPKGVMNMHDIKLGIRDYIKELGLPHTFIEVGWWLLGMLPPLHSAANTLLTQKYYIGNRDQKLVYSTLSTIGKMVAHIIIDPRTLGQTVVVYDGEIINETWGVTEKVTGEDFSDYPKVSNEEIGGVGASGYTGGAIANTLLEAGTFRLSILVREASVDKPAIKHLREAGAEVVIGDVSESPEKLETYLKGVEVLISTVTLARPLPGVSWKCTISNLGSTVVAHDGEISIDETWKIAEKVTGEDFSDYPKISDEEIERGCQQTDNWAKKIAAEYYRSLFIRGDNTLAKAVALGHLDSRKLHDDIPYPDVEEVARNHYRSGFVLEYSVPEELLFDVFETVA